MKCPMLKTRESIVGEKETKEIAEFQNCIGESCAWYTKVATPHGHVEGCALEMLASALVKLQLEDN